MRVWGCLWGAVLGWGMADFEFYGMAMGALLGLLAGLTLRRAIHAEMALFRGQPESSLPAVAEAVAIGPASAVSPESIGGVTSAPPLPRGEVATPAATVEPLTAPVEVTQRTARARPGTVELAVGAARDWLLGGNTIVRVGLVILFIGLSFLARYAASQGLFPVELRLALIAAAGAALLVVGYARRQARPAFGLALQGAGVAAIYLTIFAAARLFGVIDVLPAFAVMIVVCALGCALALLQNSQSLAVAAFAGGFAVPVLLSTGEGSSLVLFGYYTVLNLAVLAIAGRRAWRLVNLVGFFATFAVATAWGVLRYEPAEYAVAQSFLIVFVLIYIAAALLYARSAGGRLGSVVDSTLLFGPALIGFGLQVGLVRHLEFGSAFSALGFGAVYLLLAAFSRRRGYVHDRLLTECLLAISIGFVTVAIPLALGARWTSSAWALEAAAAFWVGMRQARWMPRLFGLLLLLVAALLYIAGLDDEVSRLPLLGPGFIGGVLIALPALAIAWWLRVPLPHSGSRLATRYADAEAKLGAPVFLFGFAFWWLALGLEAARRLPPIETGVAAIPVFAEGTRRLLVMLGFVVSAAAAAVAGRRWRWPVATWPGRVTLVPIAAVLLAQIVDGDHVLYAPGWVLWPLALGLHFALLRANDLTAADADGFQRAMHVGGVWVLTLWLADCLWLGIDRAGLWRTSWASVAALIGTTAVLLVLTAAASRGHRRWPLDRYATAYYWLAALPLAALVGLGVLITAVAEPGRTAPLPYLPLLNPVDLAAALGIVALLLWRRAVLAAAPSGSAWLDGRPSLAALAGLAFIVINTVWLRIAHHLLEVPWTVETMLASFVVQTGLAILWTLLALALMLVAHRRLSRPLWLTGAGLLALVVAKLLLVDLANAGGGERIVTFIAVGVLMLVVGYFAPLPPAAPARLAEDAA